MFRVGASKNWYPSRWRGGLWRGASTSACDAWAESSLGPFCTLTHHEKTRDESGEEADDSEHHSATIHCFNNAPSCALTSTSSADTLPSAGYTCSAARPRPREFICDNPLPRAGSRGRERLSERTLITYRAGPEQGRLRLSKTIAVFLDVCVHTGEPKPE